MTAQTTQTNVYSETAAMQIGTAAGLIAKAREARKQSGAKGTPAWARHQHLNDADRYAAEAAQELSAAENNARTGQNLGGPDLSASLQAVRAALQEVTK